jgi:hypothetical protein
MVVEGAKGRQVSAEKRQRLTGKRGAETEVLTSKRGEGAITSEFACRRYYNSHFLRPQNSGSASMDGENSRDSLPRT